MFDKENFSCILTKISKYYENQREFAKKSNVNRTYLSKYINKKLETPPKPEILKKIADASKGTTTYNELMQICGYVPLAIENTSQSIDIQLAESIFNNKMYLLDKYNLSDNDITILKDILVKRLDSNSSIESKLNDFSITSSPLAQDLFSTLIVINEEIDNALINLHKNGNLFPIPVYKNTKKIDLFLVSDIVDYINFNIPFGHYSNDYFALLINSEKMAPLLDFNDIAIIYKNKDFVNGQIVAVYSITKECCIIGKIFKYDNIIEFSYLNSKSEKFIENDITFLGKVVKAENKSAFK